MRSLPIIVGAALAIGVLIGAPFALGQEPSGPPPKDTIFARKILMGAIDMNMDAIEPMLAPNGKFDAAEAQEHADSRVDIEQQRDQSGAHGQKIDHTDKAQHPGDARRHG